MGLSDGSFFCFRSVYLRAMADPAVSLSVGSELGEEALGDLAQAAACLDAEKAALSLVARSEQLSSRLGLKLRERGWTAAAAVQVVERLRSSGLVDDERYACLWLESRIRRKSEGRVALLAGLLSRGVPRDAASSALARTVTEEVEDMLLARFLAEEHMTAAGDDPRVRKRLHAAGFSARAVRNARDPFG